MWWSLIFLFFAGCGYHTGSVSMHSASQATISIPYIEGDDEGALTNQVVIGLENTGLFHYVSGSGEYVLKAKILSDGDDRVGFRYDRNPTTGKRRSNIVGTENRRSVAVEIYLIDPYTEDVLLGPEVIRGSAEYDYVDANSIRDLTFIEDGRPQTVLNFSLGQLDSVEGAHDDVASAVYASAAQKIAESLVRYQLRASAIADQ